MSVKISKVEKGGKQQIEVASPFHPDFPKHAKNLGGRWNASARIWLFDPRDEDSVRDLCRDCFGTDGETEPEMVDCLVTLTGGKGESVWFAGREIARRPARDWNVKLGNGVVVKSGAFTSKGGSAKYPRVDFVGDSITLEVRDVPASIAQREVEDDPENIIILGEVPLQPVTVTINNQEHLEKLREILGDVLTDDEIVSAALSYYALHIEQEIESP